MDHSAPTSRVASVLWNGNHRSRQVELVLNHKVHGVFKSAWLKLILVVDHQHGVLILILSFEARHADHSSPVFQSIPKQLSVGFYYSLNAMVQARLRRCLRFRKQRCAAGQMSPATTCYTFSSTQLSMLSNSSGTGSLSMSLLENPLAVSAS